jgi:1,4-dihydroxy-2-naphthoyl-CoA synthase
MSQKPQYSLLTLLLVTAIVAGGIKLWYGPHHVVEKSGTFEEIEYTYTRDWHRNITINGPKITRRFNSDGIIELVNVHYYLNGVETDHKQEIIVLSYLEYGRSAEFGRDEPQALPPADKEEFQYAIQQEIDQIKKRGLVPSLTEYHYHKHENQ